MISLSGESKMRKLDLESFVARGIFHPNSQGLRIRGSLVTNRNIKFNFGTTVLLHVAVWTRSVNVPDSAAETRQIGSRMLETRHLFDLRPGQRSVISPIANRAVDCVEKVTDSCRPRTFEIGLHDCNFTYYPQCYCTIIRVAHAGILPLPLLSSLSQP